MTRRPLVLIALAVVVVEAALLLTDTGPDILLVAALVIAVGTLIWLPTSLGESIARPAPPPAPPELTTVRPDLRTTALRQVLSGGTTNPRHAERIRQQLVELVDDELRDVHGVDRTTDPDRAREVLGPDLDRFVTDPETASTLTPRRLGHIVALIERI